MSDSEVESKPNVGEDIEENNSEVKEEMDESLNIETPVQNGSRSSSRKRGRPKSTGSANKKRKTDQDSDTVENGRTPRIVLKNIAQASEEELQTSISDKGNKTPKGTRGRGRGRGRGANTASTRRPSARAAASKAKAKVQVSDSDEEMSEKEDEEPEEMEDVVDSEDEEEFVPKKSRKQAERKPRGRQRGGGRGRGRGAASAKKTSKKKSEDYGLSGDDDDEGDKSGELEEEEEDDTNADPNALKNGQYVLEKCDLRRPENYPIWRMEGPNMLRKLEMIVDKGKIKHKTVFAYSSFAQSMMDQYVKVKVKQESAGKDGVFTVELAKDDHPVIEDLNMLEEKYAADPLFASFEIFLKALFSQAQNSNFLTEVHEKEDEQYIPIILQLEMLANEKIEALKSQINMRDEFKERLSDCPNLKSIKRHNWNQGDQATVDRASEKGVRSVLLFGYGYNKNTLVEDKTRGTEVAQEVVIGPTMDRFLYPLHGLLHFKFWLAKRCTDKLNLAKGLNESSSPEDILDKCLEDKQWSYLVFEEFKELLEANIPEPPVEEQAQTAPVPVPEVVPQAEVVPPPQEIHHEIPMHQEQPQIEHQQEIAQHIAEQQEVVQTIQMAAQPPPQQMAQPIQMQVPVTHQQFQTLQPVVAQHPQYQQLHPAQQQILQPQQFAYQPQFQMQQQQQQQQQQQMGMPDPNMMMPPMNM